MKATDQLLHQTVALERVSFVGLDNKQAQLARDRGLREARLAAQLRSHPHVVTVYDVLADDSDIWLVMEYLQARSLSELLRTQGRLDPVDVARIDAQVADALPSRTRSGSSTAMSNPEMSSFTPTAPSNSPTSASLISPGTPISPTPA